MALRDVGGDARLGDLAGRLGYQSEAAFSRAFKRFIGLSPSAVRRSAASASSLGMRNP